VRKFKDNVLFWRQLDILPPDNTTTPIVVVGAGALGSIATFTLAKMGFKHITVIDGDHVEIHNLPNQMYQKEHVGMPKVKALADVIRQFTGYRIKTINKFVDTKEEFKKCLVEPSIVIVTVDNINARKAIFNACKYNAACIRLIDTRSTYPFMMLFNIEPNNPNDLKFYEETLFEEGDAFQGPCTAQATFYTGLQTASLIGMCVRNVVMGEDFPNKILCAFYPFNPESYMV
jgi:molybdopterin/thiamine biosynthesis adenylyltransferase